MDFKRLSEAYFAAKQDTRSQSVIQHTSLTGIPIAPGMASQQTTFTAKGDGTLEYFRRGDFRERGTAYPGLRRARCEPGELEKAWDLLGEIRPQSFPERVADPGDTISRITAFVPPAVGSLSWGPPDASVPAPGDAFIAVLAPLMTKAIEGEKIWALGLEIMKISIESGKLQIKAAFKNYGTQPICIANPMADRKSGFTLRVAPDREETEGVTPLPHEFEHLPVRLRGLESDSLWIADPGALVELEMEGESALSKGMRFFGSLEYRQVTYIDTLAGMPILTGSCYSDAFDFQS
jgi:hypothetical protein